MIANASLPAVRSPWLIVVILCAIGLRLAAAIVLRQPLESDSLSYFTMAQGLADHAVLADNFGLKAFYSIGYPLVLTPAFALFGSSVATGIGVNALLGGVTTTLIHALARRLTGRGDVAIIAAFAFALWLPGVWTATTLAKENLSTPLLVALALMALRIAGGARIARDGTIAGMLWGAGLLTGGSSVLLCLGPAIAMLALWRKARTIVPALRSGLCFLLGALILIGPWLYATDRMLGQPVLTTNTAFNFYLGNNPAATGHFVSIHVTPVGPEWEARRRALGEVGTAHWLQGQANAWIAGHPDKAIDLALRKLFYFWAPHLPDDRDVKWLAAIQMADAVLYVTLLVLGLFALRMPALPGWDRAIIMAMIVGFWLVHAAAYIIPRYRFPVVPLLIVLAAVPVADLLRRWRVRERPLHAA